MKLRITFELSPDDRKGIAEYYGVASPASYADCASFIRGMVRADIEAVVSDMERNIAAAAEAAEAE